MKQRRGGQPGHQTGVLRRVPEPPAAPAQLVISPIGPGGDAQGEEYPRAQHPGSYHPRKVRRHLPRQQRAHREAERHRQADIAAVERGRMHRQADVLQQRVEPQPLGRRRIEPLERVRGHQQEGVESQAHEGLRGERRQQGLFRQAPLHQRDEAAGQRHHRDPQQHRAFVVAPGTGDLKDQRLFRMGILRHQRHRKIGPREEQHQRAERERAEQRLHHRRRPHQRGEIRPAFTLAEDAAEQLQAGKRGGEPKRR